MPEVLGMNIQLCQMKGRGKCGRRAIAWAEVTWKAWGGSVGSATRAACERCVEDAKATVVGRIAA